MVIVWWFLGHTFVNHSDRYVNVLIIVQFYFICVYIWGVRGGAVGWGTGLQAGIPDEATGIFQSLNPSGRIVALWTLNRNEYQESFLGVKTAGA